MNTFAEKFETMMDDKRVRAVGIAVAAVLMAISMGLLIAAKSPSKPIVVGKVLPDAPANVLMLRWMPDMRVMELRALLPAPMARISNTAPQARTKTMLSRR